MPNEVTEIDWDRQPLMSDAIVKQLGAAIGVASIEGTASAPIEDGKEALTTLTTIHTIFTSDYLILVNIA